MRSRAMTCGENGFSHHAEAAVRTCALPARSCRASGCRRRTAAASARARCRTRCSRRTAQTCQYRCGLGALESVVGSKMKWNQRCASSCRPSFARRTATCSGAWKKSSQLYAAVRTARSRRRRRDAADCAVKISGPDAVVALEPASGRRSPTRHSAAARDRGRAEGAWW